MNQNPNQLDRRRFSQISFATMLSTGVAPAMIGRASAVEPTKKLGLAVVGLGGYATSSIAPEVSSCQHVRLAGVVTGDAEKGKLWAQRHGFKEDAIYDYDTIDKIAGDDRIDFVHIALPNSMHAEFAIRAAKAGKHVMVEKPMAISSKECEQIIAAAKQAGVLLGVNYRLHWEPHHVRAIDKLSGGAVGNLTNGNYEFSWGYTRALMGKNKDRIKKWLLNPTMAGGGALFDTGVYPIQAACYLTGREPVAVRGLPTTFHHDLFPDGVEETMSYELLFDDGFQALCRASYSQSFHQCTTLGPKGSVEIVPGDSRGSVFGQSGGGNPSPKRLLVNRKEVVLEQTLQQADLLDAFAQAIIRGDKTFKTPGEMGLRDIRIVEKIYESAASGGVRVNL
ncbi:Gfo/Idh/MocA family protein [Crateriforma conspicua]|uniref:Glucose--fructose oxidoreductase n=1 Tax=Crateriforma conspicua TaxID=2527996 RepID=A0A5C6FQE6_9PLAN|nr:Gfo/Idh/MocA family oxidoreductase [Crateriforma conspicua]TWU64631.1 Glucose--fructose oxidoreductase precursor [Crateriforma conspicua]